MHEKSPAQFDFNITGFVISMILVTVFAGAFALFLGSLETEFGVQSNSSFAHYNKTQEIIQYAQEINASTQISQDKGILDVIGGYFTSGFTAIKIALGSFGMFQGLMNSASQDYEGFGYFEIMFVTIVLVGLIILLISVLLKPGGKL